MNQKIIAIGILAILVLLGCTESANNNISADNNLTAGPKILECGTSCPWTADKQLSGAISELKGWFNSTQVNLPNWKAFQNPKGTGVVVVGFNNDSWCGESVCNPEVYQVFYLVDTNKPQFEKVCPLDELSLKTLDPKVTQNKVSYCKQLKYADIAKIVE